MKKYILLILSILIGNVVSAQWTDTGTNVFLTTTTDEVGIGTVSPLYPLHISRSDNGRTVYISNTYSGTFK